MVDPVRGREGPQRASTSNGVELIPGILEDSWDGVKEKLEMFEGLAEWVHIDVSDGKFTANKTWMRPQDLLGVNNFPKVEAHLMVASIDEFLPAWLESLVRRIIFHYESEFRDGKDLVKRVKDAGKEVVVAFNIETPWGDGEEILSLVDGVLFLSVRPGYSGQGIDLGVLKKASSLRAARPNLTIEVDGGVKPSFIKDLMATGATRFVSTSYIYKSKDPKGAIDEYYKEIAKYL